MLRLRCTKPKAWQAWEGPSIISHYSQDFVVFRHRFISILLLCGKHGGGSKKHDSDDEESDIPFFTMDSKKESFKTPLPNPLSLPSSSSVTVRSNPEAAHPKGIEPGSHPRYGFDLQI